MFYVHTRNRPATVYETCKIERDSHGVHFVPNYPHLVPETEITIMVPWSNVDHIQEIRYRELKVA